MASIKVGNKVELVDKGLCGRVAFVGITKFSKGKWVGIVLDEPKGKNNGTVEGVTYFNCAESHGIFVKVESPSIRVLDDSKNNSPSASMISSIGTSSGIKAPSSFVPKSNLSAASSERNLASALTSSASSSCSQSSTAIPTTNVKSLSRPSAVISNIRRQSSNISRRASTQPINAVETIAQSTSVSAIARENPQIPLGSVASSTQSSSPQHVSSAISTASNEEVEALKLEIKDLNEKLDTIKVKRAEDREKLREFEKMKIHMEQLQEFKKQITESHAELNRQLQQAKKEAKEAIEDKLKHADEMKDLAETTEIATLDKEMAEEKYEMLSKELELTKEKLEEVQLDYELLKSEVEEQGSDDVASNYQVHQLEQQNEKLREAIIKLRDLDAANKYEIGKLNKEMQTLQEERSSLEKTVQKNLGEINGFEVQISDLNEQIDFALGAQEMVEKLTDRNLELEEQIVKLKEEIDDLENLHDVNEQLQETARETELELREELDTLTIRMHDLTKRLEENQECLAEYESTIARLRDIVGKLKKENDHLRAQSSNELQYLEEEKQKLAQAENIQFKMRFAEAKVFSRAIEMDLRRLEVAQANEYIKYLSLFMPESFFIRGGDNDAIQILLFIPRVISKLHIISRQIVEKYPINSEIEEKLNSTFMFHENEAVNQQLFVRKLLFLVSAMETALCQYQDALRSCGLELYLKVASLLPELSVHEKTIDNFIELLKKDQFDETISLESFEKSLQYFINVYNLHLADLKINDCFKLLMNFTILIKNAMDISMFDTLVVRSCVQNESNNEKLEQFTLLKNSFGEIRALIKKIKRRLAGEAKLKLSTSVENDVCDSIFKVNKVVLALSAWRLQSLQQCEKIKSQSANELELPLVPYEQIEQLVQQLGGLPLMKQQLAAISSVCLALSSGLQQGDYDEEGIYGTEDQPHSISSFNSLEVKNPLEIRAEYIKAQSGQVNELKIKLETKQADLNEMKKLLKTKNEEWQEMKIRKDRIENKLAKAHQEADERVAKLQNELDDLTNTLKRREKENEDTMNHLQADIEALETERANLREKIKLLSKKSNTEGLPNSPLSSTGNLPAMGSSLSALSSLAIPSSISVTTANLSAMESSYLTQMKLLRSALTKCNDELYALKNEQYSRALCNKEKIQLKNHKPLWLLRAQGKLHLVGDENLNNNYYVQLSNLLKRARQLEKEAHFAILEETRIDPRKSLSMQMTEDRIRRQVLSSKYAQLDADLKEFKKHHFDHVDEIFHDSLNTLFTLKEQSKRTILAAKLALPNKQAQKSVAVSLELNIQQLKDMHYNMI